MSQPDPALLKGLAFFAGIDESNSRQLATLAVVEDQPARAYLFREGSTISAVFVVISGSVALEMTCSRRGRLRFQTVGPGELLGWSPLLGQSHMTATARTVTPTQVLRLEAQPLLELCDRDPRFGMEIMRRVAKALSQRLAATRLQLLDVYGHELPALDALEGPP